jgi:ABC-type uncharacterized transport system substrate-binding protein
VKRREFITLAGGVVALPLAVSAQDPGRTYRLGFLVPAAREEPAIVGLFDELRLAGFIEGQNLSVVADGFDIRRDQLAERAAAVVEAAPDAIVTGPDLYTRVLQQLTQSIPLIGLTEDMVAERLTASLARPGGNTTGISLLSPELDGKRQEILIEAIPSARRIAALADSNVALPRHLQTLRDAARARGVTLSVCDVGTPEEIAPAIEKAKASGAEALNVLATPLFFTNRAAIIDRAATLRLPAIYQWPEMAKQGGLLAYGPRFEQVHRQRARMVIKILRGAKPADVPVEQPTKFELVINLKTAKALGLAVPTTLLARADEIIE